MKIFVQFLTRGKESATPVKLNNDVHILDERQTLNSHIVESFELIDKHEQKEVIIGFNIVEVHAFQNKEIITHQNIFDF